MSFNSPLLPFPSSEPSPPPPTPPSPPNSSSAPTPSTLPPTPLSPPYHTPSHGLLHNANTIDQFKTFDTTALLHTLGSTLWADLLSSTSSPPSPSAPPSFAVPALNRFLLLTFADVKSHKFYYWFAFPALIHPGLTVDGSQSPQPLLSSLSSSAATRLIHQVNALSPVPPYFLIVDHANAESLRILPLAHLPSLLSSSTPPSVWVGFIDPSSLPTHPGWPLRNVLLYLAVCGVKEVKVVCYRDLTAVGVGGEVRSVVLDVTLEWKESLRETTPRCVGYERNLQGKLAPRLISLSSLMSPLHLAESSVNLNLRLMRWRALPSLNLPLLASTRVLLLGAGTLGCSVARLLLAWGIHRFTFVDSGTVSYSNPVRQSLFRHEDCVGGGTGES